MDNDKAANARRKIELYRRYLAEGVTGELADMYLAEVVKLQIELDAIERAAKKR